jgi:hypothetical protein
MTGSRFQGLSPPWPPALRAGTSESATECGYEIVFVFWEPGFLYTPLEMPGLNQGFNGYNRRVWFHI